MRCVSLCDQTNTCIICFFSQNPQIFYHNSMRLAPTRISWALLMFDFSGKPDLWHTLAKASKCGISCVAVDEKISHALLLPFHCLCLPCLSLLFLGCPPRVYDSPLKFPIFAQSPIDPFTFSPLPLKPLKVSIPFFLHFEPVCDEVQCLSSMVATSLQKARAFKTMGS